MTSLEKKLWKHFIDSLVMIPDIVVTLVKGTEIKGWRSRFFPFYLKYVHKSFAPPPPPL